MQQASNADIMNNVPKLSSAFMETEGKKSAEKKVLDPAGNRILSNIKIYLTCCFGARSAALATGSMINTTPTYPPGPGGGAYNCRADNGNAYGKIWSSLNAQ